MPLHIGHTSRLRRCFDPLPPQNHTPKAPAFYRAVRSRARQCPASSLRSADRNALRPCPRCLVCYVRGGAPPTRCVLDAAIWRFTCLPPTHPGTGYDGALIATTTLELALATLGSIPQARRAPTGARNLLPFSPPLFRASVVACLPAFAVAALGGAVRGWWWQRAPSARRGQKGGKRGVIWRLFGGQSWGHAA